MGNVCSLCGEGKRKFLERLIKKGGLSQNRYIKKVFK